MLIAQTEAVMGGHMTSHSMHIPLKKLCCKQNFLTTKNQVFEILTTSAQDGANVVVTLNRGYNITSLTSK